MRTATTRFMRGYTDAADLFLEVCTMRELCESDIDIDNAIISSGFESALRCGRKPILNLIPDVDRKLPYKEYHHIIIDGTCYIMYFEDEEN